MVWIIGTILALFFLAALALQFAISANGPAVLSAVDRVAGGGQGAKLLEAAQHGPDEGQMLYVWSDPASTQKQRPVIVFSHGGSWNSGDAADYAAVARAFVPKGFVVVLAGYRLHPHAVYPSMLEDTASAISWTYREIARHGGDPEHIVVAGHSAGAYNVVTSVLEKRWLDAQGVPHSSIKGVIGLAGPFDFYPFDSDATRASFGHVHDPQATQPINHIRGDAPPMLLIHGEQDTTVRPRNSRVLAEALKAAGASAETIFYPDMDHTDPLVSLAAPWRNSRAIDEKIAEFAAKR